MKSTCFTLTNPQYQSKSYESGFQKQWVTYTVPILPAFAITNYSVQGMLSTVDGNLSSISPAIVNDSVIIDGVSELHRYLMPREPLLVVNYLGIRDYELFFPHIEDDLLRERAANYMEEADKTFDESSWLSFVLMAGAVFESYLVDLTGDHRSTFGKLIAKLEGTEIFDGVEMHALKDAADARNLIHAGRFKEPFVSRERAMEVRSALESFLRKDWESIKHSNA